jgi:protein-disulfide isomerase
VTRSGRLLLLAGAALVAVLVVAVAIVISQGGEDEPASGGGGSAPAEGQSAEVGPLFDGIPQDGVSLGEPDAPATLTEFADLQCPFCAEYAREALPAVIDRYVRTGRVRLELQLLSFIGPDSQRGAQVAAAAAQQDRMWQFSDLFFNNQGAENSGYATDDFLRGLARETPGLDVEQAFADRDSPAARRLLRQAQVQATALGVNSTPTFLVRQGAAPPQPLQLQALDAQSVTAALDQALAGG